MARRGKRDKGADSDFQGFGDLRLPQRLNWGTYSRVSTGEQTDSIPVQNERMQILVHRSGGRIEIEASDIASGTRSKKRPGYQSLKTAIRKKKVNAILARDTSRFGRNPAELLHLFDLCRQNNVLMWDMQMGRLTELHLWCLGLVAKMQVSTGVGQIHMALLSKSMKGLRAGGTIYGYDCVALNGEKGHVRINDVQAGRVRQIYDWADLNGLSARAVARILNKRGIPSPRGGKWLRKTIQYILQNPFYCSHVLWNCHRNEWDVETEISRKVVRPDSEHVKVAGRQESIILVAQWQRVQSRLARPPAPHSGRKPGPPTFLSGRLKCPQCEGSLMVCGGDGKKLRVACGKYIQGACENNRTFYRHHVFETCLTGLLDVLATPTALEIFLEEQNRANLDFSKSRSKDRMRLQRSADKIRSEIDRLVDAVAAGSDPEIFNVRIEDRKRALSRATIEIEDLDAAAVHLEVSKPSLRSYQEYIERLLSQIRSNPGALDPELSEQVEALIDHVVVTPNQGRRGFSLELFGDLARLVTGRASFKAAFRKNNKPTDIHGSNTITISNALKRLVFLLFTRGFEPGNKGSAMRVPLRKRSRSVARAARRRRSACPAGTTPRVGGRNRGQGSVVQGMSGRV